MMHKSEKITLIIKVYKEKVKSALIASEIGEFDIHPSEDSNHVKLDAAVAWLDAFVKGEIAQFNDVYAMLPPDVWSRHKLFGLNDLIEMKMLKIAKKDLRDAWMKRPGAIRRTYGNE